MQLQRNAGLNKLKGYQEKVLKRQFRSTIELLVVEWITVLNSTKESSQTAITEYSLFSRKMLDCRLKFVQVISIQKYVKITSTIVENVMLIMQGTHRSGNVTEVR